MGISFRHRGNFKRTEKFLKEARAGSQYKKLTRFGEEGVHALASATPVRSGLTADSWRYEIEQDSNGVRISWYNDNDQNGWFNVAIGLQYGHGTGTGGWVEGIDYINPAIKPVFEKMAEDVWQEICNL